MSPQKPHDYRTAPPGQASVRDLVCTKCGVRRSVGGLSECPGVDRGTVVETISDYDPMEGST